VAGHDNTANITVELPNGVGCSLAVVGSSYAWNSRTNSYLFNNGAGNGEIIIGAGGPGRITATTPSRFFLK
jgi:hypothetical protein